MTDGDGAGQSNPDPQGSHGAAEGGAGTAKGGNTYKPFMLKHDRLPGSMTLRAYVLEVRQQVTDYAQSRTKWYDDQRRAKAPSALQSRKAMALIGTASILVTATAMMIRTTGMAVAGNADLDKYLLIVATVGYAVMAAIGFYVRTTESGDGYFRALGVIFGVRDLRTALEFDFANLLQEPPPAIGSNEDAALRKKARDLAQTFCKAVDALATDEFAQWRTAFKASTVELERVATSGLDKALADLKSTYEARLAASLKEAAEAKAALAALAPAHLNITLTGGFDGTAVILVDGKEEAKTSLPTVALTGLAPGVRKIEVTATRGTVAVGVARSIDAKSGVQDVTLALASAKPGTT